MKFIRTPATLAAIAFATLIIPLSAAVAAGLVPCDGIGCQLCSVAKLAQNIINFTVEVAIPIAALLFAYAGWLYITAGGSLGQVQRAHGIFGKVALGFILSLSGYLIVNSILVIVANPGSFVSGEFFAIECVDQNQRPTNKSLTDLLSGTPTVNVVSSGYCMVGYTEAGLGTCRNDADGSYRLVSGYQCSSGAYFDPSTGCVDNLSRNKVNPALASTILCPSGYTYNGTKNVCEDEDGNTVGAPSSAAGIAAAANAYYGQSTASGPDGGNLACAWAVNNILQSTGIAPIDGNSVSSMEQVLQSGRGIPEEQSVAQAGDIIIFGGTSHVGICQNSGCTQVISNSSSNASFTNVSGAPQGSRFYRVN